MAIMIKLIHWRASFDDIVCASMITDFDSGGHADDGPVINGEFGASPPSAAACHGLPLAVLRDILTFTVLKIFLAIR